MLKNALEPPLPVRARLLLPLLLLVAACPGQRPVLESGATWCNDGLDNDDDGLIDCKDPDCHPLAICSPGDLPVKQDLGAGDGPLALDWGPAPDLKPPQPDLPPSSYGKRCQAGTSPTTCPDGKTECVLGSYGTPGFCTVPCDKGGPPCPDGPEGTEVHCSYEVLWGRSGYVWYCLFFCQNGASCPHDTQCVNYPFCF